MNTLPVRTNFVCVAAVDLSALGDRALHEAATLQDSVTNLALHVVVVGRAEDELIRMPGREMAALTQQEADEFACRHVDALVKTLHEQGTALGLEYVTVHVVTGDPAQNIVELASVVDADRIVLGTHGGDGLKRRVLGSVAERVARTATCGVHIIRPRDFLDGEPLPAIQPPLEPGEHPLIQFKHVPTHHYVGRDSTVTSRMMPIT